MWGLSISSALDMFLSALCCSACARLSGLGEHARALRIGSTGAGTLAETLKGMSGTPRGDDRHASYTSGTFVEGEMNASTRNEPSGATAFVRFALDVWNARAADSTREFVIEETPVTHIPTSGAWSACNTRACSHCLHTTVSAHTKVYTAQ